jgi:hypothetical protein
VLTSRLLCLVLRSGLFPSGFAAKRFSACLVSPAFNMSRPAQPPAFDHLNYIWCSNV